MENQSRSTIVRPHYRYPNTQAIPSYKNISLDDDKDDIYVFVKPLKDTDKLLERLTRLRNAAPQRQQRQQMTTNPYNIPMRAMSPVIKVVRKKPKSSDLVNFELVPEDLTTSSTTETPIRPTRPNIGTEEYIRALSNNRNARVVDRSQTNNNFYINDNQNLNNNNGQREVVYRKETGSYQRPNATVRQPYDDDSRYRNRQLIPDNHFNEQSEPMARRMPEQNHPAYQQLHREAIRPQENPNLKEVTRPDPKPVELNSRDMYESDVRVESKPLTRSQPVVELRTVYQPEVIPPYELDVPQPKEEPPVIIQFNAKNDARDAVVISPQELRNRGQGYLDFLGVANSPKINPDGIRIVELPPVAQVQPTTRRPT